LEGLAHLIRDFFNSIDPERKSQRADKFGQKIDIRGVIFRADCRRPPCVGFPYWERPAGAMRALILAVPFYQPAESGVTMLMANNFAAHMPAGIAVAYSQI
jgi:hypothetical protein